MAWILPFLLLGKVGFEPQPLLQHNRGWRQKASENLGGIWASNNPTQKILLKSTLSQCNVPSRNFPHIWWIMCERRCSLIMIKHIEKGDIYWGLIQVGLPGSYFSFLKILEEKNMNLDHIMSNHLFIKHEAINTHLCWKKSHETSGKKSLAQTPRSYHSVYRSCEHFQELKNSLMHKAKLLAQDSRLHSSRNSELTFEKLEMKMRGNIIQNIKRLILSHAEAVNLGSCLKGFFNECRNWMWLVEPDQENINMIPKWK